VRVVRTLFAVAAGKAARLATRLRGGGSAFPGLVAERIDPTFLATALSDVRGGIVVVSGTNGKTTTTKMLAEVLRAHGRTVFSNPTGSNFTRGVISSLLGEVGPRGRVRADIAVLELDEAHSIPFARTVPPTHALLLNVARDQLDRFAEIDHTAALLARLAALTTQGLVLNRDDSFIARIGDGPTAAEGAAPSARPVRYFGVHPSIADRLPELLEADLRADHDCAAAHPAGADGLLRHPWTTARSRWSARTAATASSARSRSSAGARRDDQRDGGDARPHGMVLGEVSTPTTTATGPAAVAPPFGRGEVIDVDGQPLELVLVKNPAGFTVALGTYGASPSRR
jgi:hypothetical protein